MDNTFFNVHPNERIFYRSNRQNHFLKAIFKKQVKKITEKTAKKAGLSDEATKKFNEAGQKAISTGALGNKINRLNTSGNILAVGTGLALTGGLASGAIAPGLLGAKAAALGGAGLGVKKVAEKTVDISDQPWLGGGETKSRAQQGIDSLKKLAKEKAAEALQDLKDTAMAKIINDNRTSPELLPKTREQNRTEQQAIAQGSMTTANINDLLKNPLIIVAIVLLVLGTVVAIVKKQS